MASIKPGIVCTIGACLLINACVVASTNARPSRSNDASLQTAEKLLTDALKKEIDDELSEPLARSEKKIDSLDSDIFAEVLEEAVKDVKNNYGEGSKHTANSDKAIEYSKTGLEGNPLKESEVSGTRKNGIAVTGQRSKEGKNIEQNVSGFEDGETLQTGPEVPTRRKLRLHKAKEDTLKQLQQGSGFKTSDAKAKGPQGSKLMGKGSIYAGKTSKADAKSQNTIPSQTEGEGSEVHHQLSEDDIEAKIREFYKMLRDYTQQNDVKTEPFEAINFVRRQQVLPLDTPLKPSLRRGGYRDEKAWLQKREESNEKLVAEIEQLAAALKQAGHDTPNDEFPSFSQWFRYQRDLRKKGNHAIHEKPRPNDVDDALRTGNAKNSEVNYPWSRYFRETQNAEEASYQKERREPIDSAEEKFMDEIEARVAELQQQLITKRHKKRIPTLRM